MNRLRARLALVVLAVVSTALALGLVLAARRPGSALASVTGSRPRLVLLLVVDQFRADYLERFDADFGGGGFRRLQRAGAVYRNARYRHATTATGPGHASIVTGADPCTHGIVGNEWLDRSTLALVDCTSDPTLTTLGATGDARGGDSPARLRVPTIGDELVMARGAASRVIAISLKGYSATLLAGRLGKALFWEPSAGGFTSSSYYFQALPEWVVRFDAARPSERWRGASWDRLLPASAYASLGPDDAPWERDVAPLGRVFPHPFPGQDAPAAALDEAVSRTPFATTLEVELAEAAIDAQKLGQQPGATDLLAVSFSAIDKVGHRWGMESHELLDAVARLDLDLERLLDAVDARVGLEHTLVILTADHGMSPTPEVATAKGFPVGRIAPDELRARASAALQAGWNAGDVRVAVNTPNVYLDAAGLAAHGIAPEAAERAVAAALRDVPGIAYALCRQDLLRGLVPPSELGRSFALAFDADRSGDVVVAPAPYWYLDDDPHEDCATHGSPWAQDTHVPLIVFGGGIVPGRHERPVTPLDIAPTIARLVGIERPAGAGGEPLIEAITGRGW